MQVHVRHLGIQPYTTAWQAMREFTDARDQTTADELWLVEHPSVFTLGRNGSPDHILQAGDIPVVESDRGGQVTYHGPGQLVVYTLLDLQRLGIGVKTLIHGLEHALVRTLAGFGIRGEPLAGAPGVYVDGAKIASLGLRVRKGCSFHGLSLNVDMDLEPFQRINPCGYAGLRVTSLAGLGVDIPMAQVATALITEITREFGYSGNKPISGISPRAKRSCW
jgi:lipoyl(octanoyl) transferase